MSEQEAAYAATIGVPLTATERDVARKMHEARAHQALANIRALQTELRIQHNHLEAERQTIRTLTTDWIDLGPDSTICISDTERRRIMRGIPCHTVEISLQAQDTILPDFTPDETARITAGKLPHDDTF